MSLGDRGAAVGLGGRVQGERLRLGRGGLLRGDRAGLDHRVEHVRAAGEGLVLVPVDRAVRVGRLDQAGEQGRLGQGQVGGRLAEVALAGRGDAVRPGTEVRDVEVAVEDLVLAEGLLQRVRVPDLLELAPDGLLGGGLPLLGGAGGVVLEHVADVLHGQRGPALLGAAAGDVGDQGAEEAAQVGPAVGVETAVLGGHDRLPHHRGDLGEGHVGAVDVVERRDQGLAVVGVEVGALGLGGGAQRVGQLRVRPEGRLGGEPAEQVAGQRDDREDEPGEDAGEQHGEQPRQGRPGRRHGYQIAANVTNRPPRQPTVSYLTAPSQPSPHG